MVNIRPKAQIEMKLKAIGQSHSRTKVMVRDVYTIVDEPEIRGGTNLAPSPTETMMTSLIACTTSGSGYPVIRAPTTLR
ncbi:MAG: OsmC family protein [Paracoccaceae bacterium]